MTTTKITVSHPATFQTPIIVADGLSYNRVDYGVLHAVGNLNVDVRDFNADGNLDLATYLDSLFEDPRSNTSNTLLGDGHGKFTVPAPFTTNFLTTITSSNNFSNTSSIADFNADGKDDLVTINSSNGIVANSSITVLLGNSSGGYATKTVFDVGSVSPRFVGVADFNNDGKPDLITVNNQNISVLLNTTIPDSLPTGELTITGTPLQNQALTISSDLADVDGLGTISYQWFSDNSAISDATQNTYTPSYLDVGKTISVVASYTDGLGNLESIQNSATAVVANVNDLPTGAITIAGNPTQGQTLDFLGSLRDEDRMGTLSYQWLSNNTPISGETNHTYTLTQAEVGKVINVKVSYIDGQGTAESVTSSSVTVSNVNDLPTGSVLITGTTTQGQTLTASNTLADLDGLGEISYQWQANGKVISGATASSYKLTQEEVGKTVSVKTNYTDLFGTPESVVSLATTAVANVNDLPIGLPTILGKPIQGEILEISGSLRDEDGMGNFSVQWLSNGKVISGAIQGNYTLTQAEVGKTISVQASYIDGQGTAENVTSSVTTKSMIYPQGRLRFLEC